MKTQFQNINVLKVFKKNKNERTIYKTEKNIILY